jgi:CDP-paratose 2-epimerase
MYVLVTGSSGLIGSEAVQHYDALGHQVVGVDNNMRADFFGPDGDTAWNLRRLQESTCNFHHLALDIRDRKSILDLFIEQRFDLIVHCAAQPSHDLAARRPFDDFDVNAVGTLNLLEATRRRSPDAVFVHMSTNKVYGDAPNEIPLVERPTRWEYADPAYRNGIPETMRIDQSLHSLFGASKLAADVMAQEYGRYFGLRVGVFRGGCLTGPAHSGVELHGFLAYLIRAAKLGRLYRIFGYKGKQVRDNIHSYDVIMAVEAFRQSPRCGEVYNIGGGRENSISILEAIERLAHDFGVHLETEYVDRPRSGDHICYISDLTKLRTQFPHWDITRSLDDIFKEIWDGIQVDQ